MFGILFSTISRRRQAFFLINAQLCHLQLTLSSSTAVRRNQRGGATRGGCRACHTFHVVLPPSSRRNGLKNIALCFLVLLWIGKEQGKTFHRIMGEFGMELKHQGQPKPKLATSLEGSKDMGTIPAKKQSNLQQCKKKRQQAKDQSPIVASHGQVSGAPVAKKKQRLTNCTVPDPPQSTTTTNPGAPKKNKKGKSSKHRNE